MDMSKREVYFKFNHRRYWRLFARRQSSAWSACDGLMVLMLIDKFFGVMHSMCGTCNASRLFEQKSAPSRLVMYQHHHVTPTHQRHHVLGTIESAGTPISCLNCATNMCSLFIFFGKKPLEVQHGSCATPSPAPIVTIIIAGPVAYAFRLRPSAKRFMLCATTAACWNAT